MKKLLCFLVLLAGVALPGSAAPLLLEDVLGRSLGGWKAKGEKAADYEISGVKFRTWRPHVTPTLDGGIFVSLRIDHRRGFMASDDHASLELSFGRDGEIVSAQSTIALQGRKITSDVIRGSSKFGTSVAGVDKMVKVGTDLVASLTAKMLREKVTEPGRVGFPAAVRHNYNLLCMAISPDVHKAVPIGDPEVPADPVEPVVGEPETGETEAEVPASGAPGADKPGDKAPDPKAGDNAVAPAPELKILEQGKPPEKTTTKKKLATPEKG